MAVEYPRPELVAEPDWLWAHRDDPAVRVVDCGTPDAYDRAHIPGAVRLLRKEDVPADGRPGQWLKDDTDPVHVMSSTPFAAWMSRLGVGDDTTVVAYDSFNGTFATRLWWVLTYYGHPAVKVLNGGWQRWVDEGHPVTFRESVPEPPVFTPRPNEAMRIRLDELRALYTQPEAQVVNVLPPAWYAGTSNPFGNKHAGHIPGSTNVPIERFFRDSTVPTLKPAAELQDVLTESRLSRDKDTVIHCQAGVRTTMGVFVTSLLGWDHVRAYDASLAEWANRDDTPVATELP